MVSYTLLSMCRLLYLWKVLLIILWVVPIYSFASLHSSSVTVYFDGEFNGFSTIDYNYDKLNRNYSYQRDSIGYFLDRRYRDVFYLFKGFGKYYDFMLLNDVKFFSEYGLRVFMKESYSFYSQFTISVGSLLRITEKVSAYCSLNRLFAIGHSDAYYGISFGFHFFKGAGYSSEYKSEHLKKRKRSILRPL